MECDQNASHKIFKEKEELIQDQRNSYGENKRILKNFETHYH